jgi:hypothetical protein
MKFIESDYFQAARKAIATLVHFDFHQKMFSAENHAIASLDSYKRQQIKRTACSPGRFFLLGMNFLGANDAASTSPCNDGSRLHRAPV